MRKKYPKRFRFSTLKNPVNHKKIISEFEVSRVYMGASRSDGISTSFLEALATGAYPIQTSTSCAGEWVKDGAQGSIVSTDENKILFELRTVLNDFELLENAQSANLKLARERLSFEKISQITKTFYF
jgi:glycosyltransferase involved in cell wall biosynthesis